MSLLGIDIGMTGCKAAVFSLTGRTLALAYREYPTHRPQSGWVELDSALIWQSVQSVIAEAAARAHQTAPSDPITALAVSAMGEAVTPVSRDRRILGHSIPCADLRGAEHITRLQSRISPQAFYTINPNILSPNYTLPKLLWLRDHDPDLFRRTDHFLLWGGLVEFLLGAEPCVSYSHANRTLLFDIHQQDWSDELLALTNLDRSKLPRCVPSGTVIGEVSPTLAPQLNLPPHVKIVMGGHDQCCNALGAGIIHPGRAVDGLGTVECLTPVYAGLPDPAPMLAAGLNVEHHVLPGLYVSFLYNQAGTLLRWFRDTFAAAEKDPAIYSRLDRECPPDPTDLLVLPYFEPTGPPAYFAQGSGTILGLKTATTRGHIYKALLESITFYFADAITALQRLNIDTSEFIATGGGARSDTWLQIKADILGVPYTRLAVTEAGLLGAALLAGHATGALDLTDAVAAWIKPAQRFDPRPRHHALYQSRLTHYRETVKLMGFAPAP